MEIPGGSVTRGTSNGPQDWAEADRRAITAASLSGMPIDMRNSFAKAAFYNTQNYRPNEYNDMWIRHVYYDFISYVLMFPSDPNWKKIKAIRFFDAANITTGQWALGSSRSLMAGIFFSADSQKLIKEINETLFRENMMIIKNLLYDVKFPFVIPQGCFVSLKSPAELSGIDFDIQMVDFEQRIVGSYISNNQSAFTSSVVSEINGLLKDDWKQIFIPATFLIDYGIPWSKSFLNVKDLTFMEYKHRAAIGKAMVFFFHRKSYSDYETYMKAH